eukprot:2362153-Amphidinium_carterae.1
MRCIHYALCGSSIEHQPMMSLCVLLSPEYKERTKHTMPQRKKSIQETAQYEEPPGLAHWPLGGQNQSDEYEHVNEVKLMQSGSKRTLWA